MTSWGLRFAHWLMKHSLAAEDVELEILCRDAYTAHRVRLAMASDLDQAVTMPAPHLGEGEFMVAGVRGRVLYRR
ncbi:hypothetical protein [uncultured Methylobacterium sp.]|uniref:hypothetical protein n=1 Tax=uncultured Methylobacterium sp. TaxID=157278 RepID=UPI0035CB303E